MSILDTFYILFKADTSDLKKGTEEADKQQKKLKKSVEETDKVATGLGKNFVQIIENSAAALGVTFSAIGIATKLVDVSKVNSALYLQGRILNQNIGDINTYGQAVKAAGGDVNAFQAYLRYATQQAADAGLKLPPIEQFFRNIRQELNGLSSNEKLRRLNLLGITDPGMISLLESSNEEFERSIENAKKLAERTEEDGQKARALSEAWSNVGTAIDTIFTKIGSESHIFDSLTNLGNILSALLSGQFKKAFNLWRLTGSQALSETNGNTQSSPTITPQNNHPSGSAKESFNFWLSQGYSPQQAAGLVANEERESNFNPSAVGDNGQAQGIFQWHGDRRQRILAGTGIDVTNASHADQLRAAAWELQNMGVASLLHNARSPEEASSIVTRKFEMPARTGMESVLRGFMADHIFQSLMMDMHKGNNSIANGSLSPLSSNNAPSNIGGDKTINLKIDNIQVNAPNATDADSIAQNISQGINSHFRNMVSNYDDGIKA